MNVDIENQENFEKKKKIVLISLSAAIVFITLIAGLLFAKKSKESNHENNDIEKVINNNVNDNDNEKPNSKGTIANEDEYFFNRTSGQVTINILSFLIIGILFFFWENIRNRVDKKEVPELPEIEMNNKNGDHDDNDKKRSIDCNFYITSLFHGDNIKVGLTEESNWFGLLSLIKFIAITILVEFIFDCLLIGSLSFIFSVKIRTMLRMFYEKRIQFFSSYSKIRILLVILVYLLCAFIIAIVARMIPKICCRELPLKDVV